MPRDELLSPWPQRTTLIGGVGLIVADLPIIASAAGLLDPIAALAAGSAILWIFALVGKVALCVALVVLAVGVNGETNAVGKSIVGRASLVVWGLAAVLDQLLSIGDASVLTATNISFVSIALKLIAIVAAVIGAIAVARGGVIVGIERWALLIAAVAQAVLVISELVPLAGPIPDGLSGALDLLRAVLLLVAGVVMLYYGRLEGLKHHARTLEERW